MRALLFYAVATKALIAGVTLGAGIAAGACAARCRMRRRRG